MIEQIKFESRNRFTFFRFYLFFNAFYCCLVAAPDAVAVAVKTSFIYHFYSLTIRMLWMLDFT